MLKRPGMFAAVAAVVMSMLAGCASDRMVISQADRAHDDLKAAVVTDAELAKYLQDVGDRIIVAARKFHAENGQAYAGKEDNSWMFVTGGKSTSGGNSGGMQFHFVNSNSLNAFTTGGNHMYIYTELFQQCSTEDELAAVMAHEFAHVYGRHVHKGMNRQMTTLGVAAGAGVAGAAIGGKERGAEYGLAAAGTTFAAGQFVGMGYTRRDEAEADDLGFEFYTRAGWNPNRFDDFFQKMIDKGYDTTPEMMSDHPSLKSRVDSSKQRAAALPPDAKTWRKKPIAGKERFAALQARSVAVGKKMPQDKTLENAQALLASFNSCFAPGHPAAAAR